MERGAAMSKRVGARSGDVKKGRSAERFLPPDGPLLFTVAIQKKSVSLSSFIATLVSSFVHENILFCFSISRFSGFLTTLTKKVLDLFPVF